MLWSETINWFVSNGYKLYKIYDCDYDSMTETNTSDALIWTMTGSLHNLCATSNNTHLLVDVNMEYDKIEDVERIINVNLYDYPVILDGNNNLKILMKTHAGKKYKSIISPDVKIKMDGYVFMLPGSYTGKNLFHKWLDECDIKLNTAPSVFEIPKLECDIDLHFLPQILSRLNVLMYKNRDDFVRLIDSVYGATNGTGLNELFDYVSNFKDSEYTENEMIVEWNKLHAGKKCHYTYRTLLRDANINQSEYINKNKKIKMNKIDSLGKSSNINEIREAIEIAKKLDIVERHDAIETICDLTGRSKVAIKKLVNAREKIDIPRQICDMVLDTAFDSGDTLEFSVDKNYWKYEKTHWVRCSSDEIRNTIKKYADFFETENPGVDFSLSSVIVATEVIVRASVSLGNDILGNKNEPRPIINCINGEVWIDENKIEKRKHSPKSLLTFCLDILYDKKFKCELFNDTLHGIFSPLNDCEGVVRHIWEVIGYIIQPSKWIPSWFLFYGRGSNGKSLILDVILKLLGDAARPIASISELSTSRNQFALSECVGALGIIDDDVKINTILQDDILKKLSEGKSIRAQFKHKNMFTFRNCATVILAANNWPQVRDLSEGMMRRAYGFPFFNKFAKDANRKERILKYEMEGILNNAIGGLLRLRERGDFDVPQSCKDIIKQWMTRSNQLLLFLHEKHNDGKWSTCVSIDYLWDTYCTWTIENRMQKTYTMPGFKEALVSYGMAITDGKIYGKNEPD